MLPPRGIEKAPHSEIIQVIQGSFAQPHLAVRFISLIKLLCTVLFKFRILAVSGYSFHQKLGGDPWEARMGDHKGT